MTKKYHFYIATLVAIAATVHVHAQPLLNSEWVLGCNGGEATVSNTLFTFTAGEPITETIVGAQDIATQGFQQPYILNANNADTTKIWVPTAFSPFHSQNLNDTFKPVYLNKNFTDYEFVVWSRWRLKVFTSNDIDQGWDGTYNNERVPPGAYVWAVKFNTKNAQTGKKIPHKKIGVVHLIH
jgi:gliding motility-associated-like protein